MAAFSFTDAVLVVNSVTLTTLVRSVTLNVEAEDLETTTMGGGGYRSRIGGLKSGTLEVEFLNDFAASQTDATLWPIFGTVVTFSLKPTSAAVSATNPLYSGSVLVTQVGPLDGEVGALAVRSVSWPTSGTVTRATV
jgi:hypothetical protein